MNDSGNVRTLDFSKEKQLMPEDVFEGGGEAIVEGLGEPVPQFTEAPDEKGDPSLGGAVVTGDFGPGPSMEPLTAATLHQSEPFIYIEIPELGIQVPLSIPTAVSLFDTLGAAINGL